MATITFYRENFGDGNARRALGEVAFEFDRIRIADLIRLRVEAAWEAVEGAADVGSPTWLRRRAAQGPTLEEAVAGAQRGLAANAFFLIVNGRQTRDLEEVVALDDVNSAVFLELTPLRGG